MHPKTKLQHRVVELSKQLCRQDRYGNIVCEPDAELVTWAKEKCFKKIGFRTKHQVNCLMCGYQWRDDFHMGSVILGDVCPQCGAKLKIEATPKRSRKEFMHFTTIGIMDGLQLIRVYRIDRQCQVGKEAKYDCYEIVRHWIAPNGSYEWMAVSGGTSYWSNYWYPRSEMELKSKTHGSSKQCADYGNIHPKKVFLPEIKRNGFKGQYYNYQPHFFLQELLRNRKFETLLKTGQIDLLKEFAKQPYSNMWLAKYWASIKICLRHGYIVNDASMWTDLMDLLIYFKRDLHNPKYVCPANLRRDHDRLVRKKNEILRKEREAEQMKKAAADQKRYIKDKGRYFGLVFTDGDLTINFLETMEEFRKEGNALGHCVFTNEYYNRKSLIFSAKVGGQHMETIEVSLNPIEVLQARGKGNQATEYHDRILALMEANFSLIRKRMRVHVAKKEPKMEEVFA